ncbi:hypothetical protein [Planctobacterium marinum]|uniref:Lipoprotein n=1 Tax=Planctobacterium marinum TaxID=1631968 RepID=A0AA48I3M4_9ALTE|nr:hypothetical protein MACH26_08160 [Planctobacterium marinum]
MELNKFFQVSAIAAALALAGCGGDINITEGDITGDTITNNTTNNNGGNGNGDGDGGDTPTVEFPGTFDAGLTQAVRAAVNDNSVVVQTISGTITEDTTLIAGAFYALSGTVFVGGDNTDSATLTIEPGVTVFGQNGGDALVVSRGSKLEAAGTADDQIIMTSLQDVVGEALSPGQWGGLVLLGNAPSNKCPSDGTACAREVEGVAGAFYGGTDTEDNSGTLQYVIVKNSGFEVEPGNELNGITFAGVGAGTTVDHIQVHNSSDDGVEFFGGNVDVKYLVLTNNQDDSIDWDHGYQGRMQHIYVQHNPNATDANRIIEADNDGSNLDADPKSNPTLVNMTAIGNNFAADDNPSEGIYLREGTGGQFYNIVVTGPAEMGECFEVENNAVSQANLQDGTIMMQNSAMACSNGENFKNADGAVDLEAWFLEQDGNVVLEAPMVSSDGTPMNGSPLLGSGQDASAVDTFFDVTDYMGAFDGATDWREGWAFGFGGGIVTVSNSAPVVGCPSGTTAILSVDGVTTTCEIPSGVVTEDMTLTAGNIYALSGVTFIGNDNADSATLTIEPGVTIYGRSASDALVVSRGSEIMAEGTAAAPITFTSNQDVTGQATAPGQWGGIVLLGNAVSNKCPTDGTPCAREVEGVAGAFYGGTDNTDSSGTLRYVVVKHGGFEVEPGNELNGITFGGVGSGTTVEYIQVHQNSDDGIEFFGGTVNAKYIVLTGNQDDSVDWDHGYTGKLQYVLIQQATDDTEANRLIEADNDGSNLAATPQSNPMIANFTGIGNNYQGEDPSEGIYLREGTGGQFYNVVVTGPAGMGECLEVEDNAVSQANLGDGTLTMQNSVIACENGENFKNADGAVDLEAWFLGQDGNSVGENRAAVLNGVYTISDAAAYDFTGDTFFDNVDFIGAVEEGNDWTAGWTVGLE